MKDNIADFIKTESDVLYYVSGVLIAERQFCKKEISYLKKEKPKGWRDESKRFEGRLWQAENIHETMIKRIEEAGLPGTKFMKEQMKKTE